MAEISKRSGRWTVRWHEYRAPGAPEKRRRRRRTFRTKREAQAWANQVELEKAEIRAGRRGPPIQAKTMREVIEYLQEVRWPSLRCQKDYESIARRHLLPAFADYMVGDVTTQEIERFALRIERAPKTKKNILALLRVVLRAAEELGWLHKAPRVPMPQVFQTEFNYLSRPEEFAALIGAARAERPGIAELYATALYTGLRAGELAGLRRFDIDLRRRRIRIERSYKLRKPTKNGRFRYLPVFDPLLPLLDSWIAGLEGSVVFTTRDGTALNKSDRAFQEIFRRCLERAGLPRLRFHDLRHSFAATWVMNGGEIYKLSKLLGHSSVAVTERYAHLRPDAFADELDRLPDFRQDGDPR